ncbi:trihelix transcription factor GTL2 [Tanacetum coccineum]
MFDGVPVEQFHQFISTPSTRIPPNASLIQTPPISTSTSLNFLSFDPILFHPQLPAPPPPPPQALFQSNHFLRPPTRDQYNGNEGKVDQEIDLAVDVNDSWSNDEVIQLLRIKSSSENWFRDFTWDHVSRKLAEMGYKKSAEKCKEKFEEETCRSFSSTIGGYNKNSGRYLISEELDEHLYNNADQNTHHHGTNEPPEINVNRQEQQLQVHEREVEEVETNIQDKGQTGDQFEKDPSEMMVQSTQDDEEVTKGKKRKRKHKKFKMVQGLCVDLVNKMMAQQEEMHRRLLEDMATRDEEKIKREEAWRKEEMERVEREIQVREREQEVARDRQSTITEFLNKITSSDQKIQLPFEMNLQELQTNITNIQNPIPLSEMTKMPASENQDRPTTKDDIGKRWPRDEVLALINIRSNVNNGIGSNSEEHQTGSNKVGSSIIGGSIWERISQGMLELGYNRSAKRCKEKWENINKYFRKTKDANKKRSLDSRTCPYYHELSKLYNQEKQASLSNSPGLSSEEQENCTVAKIMPEN